MRTSAAGQDEVSRRLRGLNDPNVDAGRVSATAHAAAPGLVDVCITALVDDERCAATDDAVGQAATRTRDLLGDAVYGTGERTLEEAVHELLARRSATVAVAESMTGGLLGDRLTSAPGASSTFLGGVIAYATGAKAAVLGVPRALLSERGAVDRDVAFAMAAGVRERFGAVYGVGLTGVAGPGSAEGKPAGTLHVALAGPNGARAAVSPLLPGDRAANRPHAAVHAMDLLRRHLLGLEPFTGFDGQ